MTEPSLLAGGPPSNQVDHSPFDSRNNLFPLTSKRSIFGLICTGEHWLMSYRLLVSISTSKWPAFAKITASFILRKCSFLITHVCPVHVIKTSPAGSSRVDHPHYRKSIHLGFNCFYRINFGNSHYTAHALCPSCNALAHPAVSAYNYVLACE